jgi:hypothetical protein
LGPFLLLKGKEMPINKPTKPEPSPWEDEPTSTTPDTKKSKKVIHESKTHQLLLQPISTEFDLEGLMTDFPTAKELERFVYDQTNIVLNLKGRANKLKYQVAMDVLNGLDVDPAYIGSENPYVEKSEMIPIDIIKPTPERDKSLPEHSEIQNTFYVPTFPHPDEEARAQDKKCHMIFRKYKNGMISYEILGPLNQKPYGEKIDKYGRTRPEIIKWVDPRTGEQVAVREDGTLTPQGKRLRGTMLTYRVNNSNQWNIWVDREFVSLNTNIAHNPWDITK